MPFGHVGIEHVSICFTAPHARGPLGSWSTWSPLLIIFSPLSSPPLAASACTAGRTPLRPGAQPAVINQGQSLLCCVSRPSCLYSSWFIARGCQHPTTISVAIIHRNYAHTQFTWTTHLPEAHLEGFHRLPGAPVPWPHHPFVVECMRVGFFDLLTLHLTLAAPPALSTLTHAECAQPDVPFNPSPTKVSGILPPSCFSGGWDKRVWHPSPLPIRYLGTAVVGRGGWQRTIPRRSKVSFAARHLNARVPPLDSPSPQQLAEPGTQA